MGGAGAEQLCGSPPRCACSRAPHGLLIEAVVLFSVATFLTDSFARCVLHRASYRAVIVSRVTAEMLTATRHWNRKTDEAGVRRTASANSILGGQHSVHATPREDETPRSEFPSLRRGVSWIDEQVGGGWGGRRRITRTRTPSCSSTGRWQRRATAPPSAARARRSRSTRCTSSSSSSSRRQLRRTGRSRGRAARRRSCPHRRLQLTPSRSHPQPRGAAAAAGVAPTGARGQRSRHHSGVEEEARHLRTHRPTTTRTPRLRTSSSSRGTGRASGRTRWSLPGYARPSQMTTRQPRRTAAAAASTADAGQAATAGAATATATGRTPTRTPPRRTALAISAGPLGLRGAPRCCPLRLAACAPERSATSGGR